ncbi:MAG TPA: phosphotransferase, partial [Albitalea sp.]|nr:phosphotransferase [Albitalea sp.]
GGLNNLVFEFRAGGADYILRLHAKPGRINRYLKEQWAMRHARAHGVPTPEVLEVDIGTVELPFMLSRKIDGAPAASHPRRIEIIHELGQIAARLHRAPTHGFGPVFDWSDNQLSQCATWAEYLDGELDVRSRIATLAKARMLSTDQLDTLQAAVEQMRSWRKPPVLNHGDLRLKNVVVAPDSARVLALMDWEESLSAPAPHWELSIALHDRNLDEKQALLDGYGMTPRTYAAALPFIRAINTLNYARSVARIVRRKDTERLGWYRARLRGAFDLFVG